MRIGEVGQIVPTVNRTKCKAFEGMFDKWINERKKNGPDYPKNSTRVNYIIVVLLCDC